MTPSLPYQFALAMTAEDGTSLGTIAANHDWEPVCAWTCLHFQRRGELALEGNVRASILPVWSERLGEPYCEGYAVSIDRSGDLPLDYQFPISDFRGLAAAVASSFVADNRLREGELYTYSLAAYPDAKAEPQATGLAVTNKSPMIPVRPAALAEFMQRAVPQGAIAPGDLPVFVAPAVLEQAAAQTHGREGTETGGILIGTLRRDPVSNEIFVEVTAQIPAEYTEGSNVKLTFKPETWAAADAALKLRGGGEVFLGYWHSHPVRTWCKQKECSLEAQRKCKLARDFFSEDDVAVMRAAFPSAYCVAIVANDTAFADLTFSMFGNREGRMQSRGFYVLEETNHAT